MSGRVREVGWVVRLEKGVGAALILAIRFYRGAVSPLLGPHCRFAPTCSQYAAQAIRKHGPLKGTGCALLRILKCHPFHPGGYDPA